LDLAGSKVHLNDRALTQ